MKSAIHSSCVVFSALVVVSALTVACGASATQLVKSFNFNLGERKATILSEFSKDFPLNLDATIAIQDKGVVRLIPAADGHGFQISTEIDLSAFLDKRLTIGRTTTLPSGVAFPPFISTELYSVNLRREPAYTTKFYMGTVPSNRYLGVGIELNFVDSRFPSSLLISQNIQDKNKKNIGVVALYGPKMNNGQMVAPGGLFFATDLNALNGKSSSQVIESFVASTSGIEMRKVDLLPYDGFDVVGRDARNYRRPENQLKLFTNFRGAAQQAGLVD